jgi:hypothetical protein
MSSLLRQAEHTWNIPIKGQHITVQAKKTWDLKLQTHTLRTKSGSFALSSVADPDLNPSIIKQNSKINP